ncbi:MAG: hypothetical protein A2288_02415 [Candidatus Moranbacteria bacterium RIFOXYA12_FULL_44_15]|nr:MAG: hypothetical protein A2288_02415 [Candidatus Moranbacteria bacterium RIFOXYA12_FULL_44_15]OGI34314.1 MAG: hypothetical protein A2259_03290 [Candidatus Moranbacteria bacterium RIFOXYA2_FULL_43_15]
MNIHKIKTKKFIGIVLPILILTFASAYAVPQACSQTTGADGLSSGLNKPLGISTISDYAKDFKNIVGEKTSGAVCEIGNDDVMRQVAGTAAETKGEGADNPDGQLPDVLNTATTEEALPVPDEAVPSPPKEPVELKAVAPDETVPKSKTTAVSKPKNNNIAPSSIGKPARILAETKTVNGKKVCAKSNDKPKKSSKNPNGHIDTECCLDPDEIPNSNCHYPAEKYGKLIQRYLAGNKK